MPFKLEYTNSKEWDNQGLPPIKGKTGYLLGTDGNKIILVSSGGLSSRVSYTGAIDGANNVFITPVACDDVDVRINGLPQPKSASYYTYSGSTLTLVSAPLVGDILEIIKMGTPI